jgi:serine/threonine-protein kinase
MKACPACNSRYDDAVSFCNKDGSAVVPDAQVNSTEAQVGQIIADRYQLVRKLGEGGMGEVYEAHHVHIEKTVALKLLRPEILSNQEAVTRFRQEARSASSIGHVNIIQIDDFGTLPDGRVYLSMEFLEGEPLSSMLRRTSVPLHRLLDILIQTGSGLAAAHAKGIVHRDMKPENIYVTQKDGRDVPKILDFGIAKVSGNEGNQHLTRTGTIFGTPFYMAPEQALGQNLDARADVYAMGIIMYEVFAGCVPFRAESFMAILTQHITTEPAAPLKQASDLGRPMPPELEPIILHALKKKPEERYQTMNELVEGLRGVFRTYFGAGTTSPMAAAPLSPSQFHPVATGAMSPIATAQLRGFSPPGTVPPFGQAPGRKGLWLALAAALLLFGGGGAAWLMHKKPEAPPAQSLLATTGAPLSKGAEAARPGSAAVMVLVDSVPRGAEIWKDALLLGVTPANVQVVVGAPVPAVLRLKGYEDAAMLLDGTDTKVEARLVRPSSAAHRTPREAGGPAPAPVMVPVEDLRRLVGQPSQDPPKSDRKTDTKKKRRNEGTVDDDSDELE